MVDSIANTQGLQLKIKETINAGEFNEKVIQLNIELADYFAMGPKWHLINKLTEKVA
jgi:hypothetical protein